MAGGCNSALGKMPSIPGVFNVESLLKSTPDGGGGGGGGGVMGLATGAGCDGIVVPGLTAVECFLDDSNEPEGTLCDEECPCP